MPRASLRSSCSLSSRSNHRSAAVPTERATGFLGFFGRGEEEGGVTVVHLVGFPALLELLTGVCRRGSGIL